MVLELDSMTKLGTISLKKYTEYRRRWLCTAKEKNKFLCDCGSGIEHYRTNHRSCLKNKKKILNNNNNNKNNNNKNNNKNDNNKNKNNNNNNNKNNNNKNNNNYNNNNNNKNNNNLIRIIIIKHTKKIIIIVKKNK